MVMMHGWKWLPLTLALLGGTGVSVARAAPTAELVRGGGFEAEGKNGIGQAWASESYGAHKIQFGLAQDRAQSGKASQHIHIEEFKDGGAQIRQLGIALNKGQQYQITLWMRGDLEVPVSVGFRKAGAPYTYCMRDSFKVTPIWKEYTVTGVAAEDDANAGLYIFLAGNGDLWLDNVSAKPMGDAKAVASRK